MKFHDEEDVSDCMFACLIILVPSITFVLYYLMVMHLIIYAFTHS